jgi:L-amino acid N-acyltransferase YncA/DNA-binding transcriptional ArsR family regulator
MLERQVAETYADWFHALADATRVQILNLLAEQDDAMTVGQIVDRVPVGQSTVSAHLKVLTEARFVRLERRGPASWYRVNQACVSGFPSAADIVLGGQPRVPHTDLRVAPMSDDHADDVLAIYQAGIDTGNATFETTAPDWTTWDAAHLAEHRFVALTEDGAVAGWIAGSPTSGRCVYAGVLEHGIYVHPEYRGRGAGRLLLAAYVAATEAAGVWTLQAGVFPENGGSLALHRAAGFRTVGRRERIGRHHGRWRDVILLERRATGPDT